jgi:hypothetical protein
MPSPLRVLMNFLRIRRTSTLLILVQLIRSKFACCVRGSWGANLLRIRRTSNLWILVQLFRRKSRKHLQQMGSGFPAGCTSQVTHRFADKF